MFSKKCPRCNNKIKKQFDYCPYCSFNFKSKHDNQDYGFLGKNDFDDGFNPFENTFIDKIFNSTIKLLEKQMQNLSNEMMQNQSRQNKMPNNLRVQFFVNGKKVLPEQHQIHKQKPQINLPKISPEKIKKFSKLPKKEPQSKMKRLGGRIIYELEVPGVTDINDIFINYLENSIEIKAIADKKIYSKTLNLTLPILRYGLNRDLLIVEFQGR